MELGVGQSAISLYTSSQATQRAFSTSGSSLPSLCIFTNRMSPGPSASLIQELAHCTALDSLPPSAALAPFTIHHPPHAIPIFRYLLSIFSCFPASSSSISDYAHKRIDSPGVHLDPPLTWLIGLEPCISYCSESGPLTGHSASSARGQSQSYLLPKTWLMCHATPQTLPDQRPPEQPRTCYLAQCCSPPSTRAM